MNDDRSFVWFLRLLLGGNAAEGSTEKRERQEKGTDNYINIVTKILGK